MDVTNDLPIDVEVGQVLRFNKDGEKIALRIMRISKKGTVWAKYVEAYDREEVEQMAKEADRAMAKAVKI